MGTYYMSSTTNQDENTHRIGINWSFIPYWGCSSTHKRNGQKVRQFTSTGAIQGWKAPLFVLCSPFLYNLGGNKPKVWKLTKTSSLSPEALAAGVRMRKAREVHAKNRLKLDSNYVGEVG